MAQQALERFIYGTPIVAGKAAGEPTILAISPGLRDARAVEIRQRLPLMPLPDPTVNGSPVVALFAEDAPAAVGTAQTRYIMARAQYQQANQMAAACEYVLLSGEVLAAVRGDVQALLGQLDADIPSYAVTHAELAPLERPTAITWTLDRTVTVLQTLLDEVLDGKMSRLLGILGAALHPRGAVIGNFPVAHRQRLLLVQGALMLLPTLARPFLTFATHATAAQPLPVQLCFGTVPDSAQCWRLDWQQMGFDPEITTAPYVQHLGDLWTGDMIAFVQALRELERLATALLPGASLAQGLARAVERHQQDRAIMTGATLPTADLMTILTGDPQPQGETHFRYVEQLLQQALAERDTDAAEWVAQALDKDPQLDEKMDAVFRQMLSIQPDAVYVFVRARLSNGVTEKWLGRLQDAAEQSLQVALESGDPETLASWLTLLAREPSRYNLAEVLREGVLAARLRVAASTDLARTLLIICVKRQPELVDPLLDDPDFVKGLDEITANGIFQHQVAAIESLATGPRELFLLAISRTLDVQKPILNPMMVRTLWQMHSGQQTNTIAPRYRPGTLLERIAQLPQILQPGALDVLLASVLHDGDDAFFRQLVEPLAQAGRMVDALPAALEQSRRPLADWIQIINALVAAGLLDPQATITIYALLLRNEPLNDSQLPLVEQLTRLLSQNPEAHVDVAVLWRILTISSTLKNEHMMRVSARRIMADMETRVAEEQVVEDVRRLRKAMQWNQTGLQSVVVWWRKHLQQLSLARLQKLERALDDTRALDDLRAVVQTAIAMRRIIGNKSMEVFAADISVAYNVLQALSEGFDPDEGAGMLVDADMLRAEMNAHIREIAPDARHILAKNLKELAQLVTTLADNRSKPSFIRNDDTVERQLVRGEQQPQSAIDVMRWLSGYLDGAQKDNPEG